MHYHFLATFSLTVLLFLSYCGNKKIVDPKPNARLSDLFNLYEKNIEKAKSLQDPGNGWLTPEDCDGMIWAGKYGSSPMVENVNILAAEYPEKGKFGRRPPPWCWTKEDGDKGSKTTWSRDMAIAGLFPYAWRTKNLGIIERHISYGVDNLWKMGEPLEDGRVLYTPSMIGILYNLRYALGGKNSINKAWPNVYSSNLDGYQAHLQVMDIWLRGEIGRKVGDADSIPKIPGGVVVTTEQGEEYLYLSSNEMRLLEIRESMFMRLKEHSEREPYNPFYAYMVGLYTGDMSKAIDNCLNPDMPVGSYVRCENYESCQVAEWIWACGLILQHYNYF